MKIWNRFISFALATTLLLTVPLVSFAAGTKNNIQMEPERESAEHMWIM